LRSDDVVGRFGGEEFLVLLRDTDATAGMRVAERLRAAVESLPVPVTDSREPLRITMSLGVAAFPDPCPEPARLLYHADMAVYRSKLNGRNRVSLASPEADEGEQEAGSFRQTLESLVFALEARGAGFDGQTLRVTALSLSLAREMGIAEGSPEWQDIERGSLLHDVGKIAVPSDVLYKEGPLTAEEWQEVRQHPEIGWAMLRQVETLRGPAEIVRAHHEHYDGSGYPLGLAGEEIPLGARIFAVVDAFDAITSDRPYRAAQSESAALEEICRERGRQFDPAVVDALLKVLGRKTG
ncbi:MAG TPA: diguanylate cyclase, partial [Dehalococcoidia bacterium]|nr:diguanylate cyclase [Dehalococcoidia bacterium]